MSTNLISISNNSSNNNNQQSIEDDNPNLFWLPARLHPEIAPQEFKAFIEEATRPENLLRRTSSAFGSRKPLIDQSTGAHSNTDSSLSRKKSMLSKVYDPDEEDSNQSNPLPKLSSSSSSSSSLSSSSRSKNDPSEITRGSSMYYRSGAGRGLNGLESLTINDLQRLESLVLKKQLPSSLNYSTLMESSEGNIEDADSPGNRIKAVIRRSMSLANPPPSSGFEIPQELGLEAIDDSPLIARGPGHIIRRTARTKVRKTSLPGDGNGHRFPATRRTKLRSPSRSSPNSSKSSSTPISTSKTEPLTPSLPQALSNNQLEPDHEPSCAVYNDDPLRTGLTLETKLVNTELSARVSPYSSSSPVSSSNTNSKAHHPHSTGATTPPQTKSNRQSDQTTVSTEDDFALNSRPDSMSSNSSLLDAYIDQSASLDDNPTPTAQSGDFESKLSGSSPDQLFQSPVSSNLVIERFAGKVSKHSSNKSSGAIDSNPSLSTAVNLSPQTPQSIPPTRSQSQSPSNDSPNNMKMGGVKVMTNMMVKSAEELVSSSRNSADSYFSGMNMGMRVLYFV
ncbi:hypothetical protein BY996DRAFT_2169269 [Phakopsora pachyrhizi]|nr:hypothetical protein BY996DRAFT_2169269 [Phakopsora pachyrhizi]